MSHAKTSSSLSYHWRLHCPDQADIQADAESIATSAHSALNVSTRSKRTTGRHPRQDQMRHITSHRFQWSHIGGLRLGTVKTCRDIADQFIAATGRTKHYSTFHVVVRHRQELLKQTTRDKRRSGLQCRDHSCSDNTPVKESLHKYLSSVSMKQNLTVYLTSGLHDCWNTMLHPRQCVLSQHQTVPSHAQS